MSHERRSGLPRLYPGLGDIELAEFLTSAECRRIKSFSNVYVLPFFSNRAVAEEAAFGIGLSRLLIRNLMLLTEVSIHGPEDTPMIDNESVWDVAQEGGQSIYVAVVAGWRQAGYFLEFDI